MIKLAAEFAVGKKVRICGDQMFETGARGTIAQPPGLSAFYDESGENFYRRRQTLEGEKIYLWVIFDEPQLVDDDEDGPYVSAEIPVDNLELIGE